MNIAKLTTLVFSGNDTPIFFENNKFGAKFTSVKDVKDSLIIKIFNCEDCNFLKN